MKAYKKLKYIVPFVVLGLCVGGLLSKQRPTPTAMIELTDPSSPSYVPYPYPQTREQIIADLKYGISVIFSKEIEASNSPLDETGNILVDFAKKHTRVKVIQIGKVKNRISGMPEDYSYLIILSDPTGKYITRVAMNASGLLIGGIDATEYNPGKILKGKGEVINILQQYYTATLKHNDVKTVEPIAINISFASPMSPAHEITLNDGSIYYLDYNDHLYRKIGEKKVTGDKQAFLRKEKHNLNEKDQVIYDSIDEKIILLEWIKNNNYK